MIGSAKSAAVYPYRRMSMRYLLYATLFSFACVGPVRADDKHHKDHKDKEHERHKKQHDDEKDHHKKKHHKDRDQSLNTSEEETDLHAAAEEESVDQVL